MSAEDDDDHEATLARKCAKAFRVLAEMSHKGGAEAQVVERAGNDRNYERSRGIWTNLFGGSKKSSEENSEK